jgi:hypothetical protein
MRLVLQIAGVTAYILLQATALGIVPIADWQALAAINPLSQVALNTASGLILGLVVADWLFQRRMESAGGPLGKEIPMKSAHWAKVQNFTVWQVAWLWNGLDPSKEIDNQQTAAYPTFR